MAKTEDVKNRYFKCEWGQLHCRSVNLDSKNLYWSCCISRPSPLEIIRLLYHICGSFSGGCS